MRIRAGDVVEVRSKEEILATLDKNGRFEGLPFMPQMFQYCGQRFRVYKRAHKTCDTVNQTGGRWLPKGIHLDLRCDGEAYGGCQASCLIFWKTAWLKSVTDENATTGQSVQGTGLVDRPESGTRGCSEADVWTKTRADNPVETTDEPRYVCQATCLPDYTTKLPWWDLRQYVEDYAAGNITLDQLLRGALYASYVAVMQAGIGVGRPLRWLYDKFQSARGGIPYPRRSGTIPSGNPTPHAELNLQPGEFVRIKSYREILSTLNTENKNRGLYFDAEAVPYCGGTYRVRTRLTRFIDEKTGRLVTTKFPAIILEGVWCQARYSDCRMFCPRGIYSWWREIWLERLSERTLGDAELRSENVVSASKGLSQLR